MVRSLLCRLGIHHWEVDEREGDTEHRYCRCCPMAEVRTRVSCSGLVGRWYRTRYRRLVGPDLEMAG